MNTLSIIRDKFKVSDEAFENPFDRIEGHNPVYVMLDCPSVS